MDRGEITTRPVVVDCWPAEPAGALLPIAGLAAGLTFAAGLGLGLLLASAFSAFCVFVAAKGPAGTE